jgi:hypothetical protein
MVQLVAQLPEFFLEHVATCTSDKSNIIFESADQQDSRRRLGPLASDLPFAVGSRKILNLTHMHTHPRTTQYICRKL